MDLRPYLFEAIFNRSGTLVVKDGQVMAKAPGGLTDEEREHLREYRSQIVCLWNEMGEAEAHQEVPPYPDGRGMVKCFYCTRLVDLVCQVTRARMDGTSLLQVCEKFEMNTVH